jgi:hypothetical protein
MTKRRDREQDDQQRGKDDLADFATHWIRLVGIVLGLTVVYLELRNAPLGEFVRTFDNSSLIKIGMIIYFFGLAWGARDDTQIMTMGYGPDPRLGKTGSKEWAGMIIFVALFARLFFITDRLVEFQATVLALILVNSWTLRVIFDRTRVIIDTTYADCAAKPKARKMPALTKLVLVTEYMNGPWQRRRFLVLAILAVLQIVLAAVIRSGALAGYGAGVVINGVSGDVLIGYLPGAFFILYILISEIWMKIYRTRITADLRTIDWIERNFRLSKPKGVKLPGPHMVGPYDFSPTSSRNYVGRGGPLSWFISTT